MTWHVDQDYMPRSLWAIFDEHGETLKTTTAPGWYRTTSRAKAERDCARLNRKEERMKVKTAKAQERYGEYCPKCGNAYGQGDIDGGRCLSCGTMIAAEQAEPLTKVAFRFWYDGPGNRKNGEVVAIMPEIPATESTNSCTCYSHIGQHGCANVQLASTRTRPATVAEYTPLLKELESIGYRVQIIKRVNLRQYRDARETEIARCK
jgi:hypothetical protein